MKSWLSRRAPDVNKGDLGHVLVIAGARGFLGAPRLAAGGALRGGAGLVTIALPKSLEAAVAVGGPWEAMTLGLEERAGALTGAAVKTALAFLKRRRVSTVALGPGLSVSPGTRAFVLRFLRQVHLPLVVDADALNILAKGESPHLSSAILTPHPGEAARLLATSVEDIQSDRPRAAKRLARKFGAIAVLKGQGTIISDGSRVHVNHTGNPGLATGGTGDVLTGVIAALVSQVTGGTLRERLWRAAVLGVRAHGAAGDAAARRLGRLAMTAGDLLNFLPAAFRRIVGR